MPRRRRKTKKEERDNRPGLALEKPRLPAPPGRASVGGGEPVRPMPGASEWESLARVRRDVQKLCLAATSRWTEQGQLLRHVRRTRQHGRALGDVDARRRRCEIGATAWNQRCESERGGQHVVSAIRTTAAPDAGRAPASRRHARHRRRRNSRARPSCSCAPRRRVAEPRRSPGAAATRRRRGRPDRPGGAAGRSGRSGAKTSWAGFRGTARRQHLVAGIRACRDKRNHCASRIA